MLRRVRMEERWHGEKGRRGDDVERMAIKERCGTG